MSEVETLQRRVIELEELFSHHQHHVQQLNEVIVELRGELDTLQVNYSRQQRRLETLLEDHTNSEPRELTDEKPPHY